MDYVSILPTWYVTLCLVPKFNHFAAWRHNYSSWESTTISFLGPAIGNGETCSGRSDDPRDIGACLASVSQCRQEESILLAYKNVYLPPNSVLLPWSCFNYLGLICIELLWFQKPLCLDRYQTAKNVSKFGSQRPKLYQWPHTPNNKQATEANNICHLMIENISISHIYDLNTL